ncbi:MAG TPA: hypothetical protein EYQ63_28770 [Fuerstia sp.]|nr:hypothetical protein [Fuerstiella sp.]
MAVYSVRRITFLAIDVNSSSIPEIIPATAYGATCLSAGNISKRFTDSNSASMKKIASMRQFPERHTGYEYAAIPPRQSIATVCAADEGIIGLAVGQQTHLTIRIVRIRPSAGFDGTESFLCR